MIRKHVIIQVMRYDTNHNNSIYIMAVGVDLVGPVFTGPIFQQNSV